MMYEPKKWFLLIFWNRGSICNIKRREVVGWTQI